MIPKFREWDAEREDIMPGKGMSYGIREDYDDSFSIRFDHMEDLDIINKNGSIDRTVMMSTGLKDKNGVEIFEWDVVKVNNMKGLVKFGRYTDDEYIIYGLDGWLFSEIYHGRYIDTPLTEYVLDSDYEVEIIGNKYEHPHLLKE